jgi:hypothetical protein
MREYGSPLSAIDRLIQRAGMLTIDEAADLYRAHANRILIQGSEAERLANARARRTAGKADRLPQFEQARHAAARAWRHALPETQGPWLTVGAAIANAAGALVVEDLLDDKSFQFLIGPWQQSIGTLTPVGPGIGTSTPFPALARGRTG